MSYALGVDLGTTYTAAAIHRDGRTTTVDLGTRTAAIPSVVFLRDDEAILTGEAASRRGATEPARVAREFKRRVGDTTPILLGGSPYSADALMSKLLRWVVDTVAEREGGLPSHITVSHPANWGPYKQDLLRQAIARADLDHVATVTEPEAAVTYYASQERVEPGSIVAVYDLGGGTFDAAVVRKTADGVELLGTPEGIERLGGIDFDEAVFSHVVASLGGALDQLDPDDPSAMAAVARLRSECVEAKEALSADTEVSIPVLLPNLTTEVRLTRGEFEAMIRPPLADSMTAMKRALRSAGVEPAQLHAVLLAGGSSRIPLVAQMVSAELGRPVAVDSHPKHGVALGAALSSAAATAVPAPPVAPPVAPTPAPAVAAPPPGGGAAPVAGAAVAGGLAGALAGGAAAAAAGTPPTPPVAPPPAPPPAVGPPPSMAPPPSTPTPGPDLDDPASSPSRIPLVVGGIVAVIALLAVGWFVFGGDDDGGDASANQTTTTDAPDATGPDATSDTSPITVDDTTTTSEPEIAVCDGPDLCIEITEVSLDGDALVVAWDAFNFSPDTGANHAHFFWDTTAPEEAGNNAADFGAVPGTWELTDEQPFVSVDNLLWSNRPDGATQVCVTTADSSHDVVDPSIFHCADLPG